LRVILNKVDKDDISEELDSLNSLELDLIGTIKKFKEIDYDELSNIMEVFYSRMNLPQQKER